MDNTTVEELSNENGFETLQDVDEKYNILMTTESIPVLGSFNSITTGEMCFDKGREMENRLSKLNNEILNLHTIIKQMETTQLKYGINNSTVISCQCENLPTKDNINQTIKVKNEKIQHIGYQLKNKNNELSNIMCDYDVANKSNQKNTTKLIKLTDSMNNDMVTYSRSVQGYNKHGKENDSRSALIVVNEVIETSELFIIKERQNEIFVDIDEKLNVKQREGIVLIEEIPNKHECQIREVNEIEVEANRKTLQNDGYGDIDKHMKLLKRDMLDFELTVKNFVVNLNNSDTIIGLQFDDEIKDFDIINRKLDLAIVETNKYINAGKLKVQKQLMELQCKEYEKIIIKTIEGSQAVSNLNRKLDSIIQKLERAN